MAEFYINRSTKDGYMNKCKLCYSKTYGQSMEYKLMHRYKLTPEGYQEILVNQGSRCATCGIAPEKFYVDHDHACCPGTKSCGECVRGLLCFNCNTALGQIKDDPRILLAMVKYLESNVK